MRHTHETLARFAFPLAIGPRGRVECEAERSLEHEGPRPQGTQNSASPNPDRGNAHTTTRPNRMTHVFMRSPINRTYGNISLSSEKVCCGPPGPPTSTIGFRVLARACSVLVSPCLRDCGRCLLSDV